MPPSVAVSALALDESGLEASPIQLDEVDTTGHVVAMAITGGALWEEENVSSASALILSYTAQLSVTTAPNSANVLGSVAVRVWFALPVGAPVVAANPDAVTMTLQVSSWPWVGTDGRLNAIVNLHPRTPGPSGT